MSGSVQDKETAEKKRISDPAKAGDIFDKETFLISVNRGYETDMVEGAMRSGGIPFMIKSHGGPEGFSRFDTKYESQGSDFYVPSKLLSKARSALPPEFAAAADADGNDLQTDGARVAKAEEKEPESPLKRAVTIILFLIVISLAVFGVDYIMNIVRAYMGY